jgi:alpha-galactosidase
MDYTKLAGETLWLEKMDLTHLYQGWGRPQVNKSINGEPLKLAGKIYEHGVGTHAYSRVDIDLKQAALWFEAIAGLDDETGDKGSVTFEIWVDGKKVLETPVLNSQNRVYPIKVSLEGASSLVLIVTDAQDGAEFDHADWADARIILKKGSCQVPEIIPILLDPVPDIHRDLPDSPEFHFPPIIGGTPGREFLYRIPVSGKRPLELKAQNLPEGLSLDEKRGIISGKLKNAGKYMIQFTAQNAFGKSEASLQVIAGDRCLALTPPLGWNSWNAYGHSVTEINIRDMAAGMIESGLADFGYQYINIDDGWAGCRNEKGEIQPNEKFIDMKALGDYVHSLGLKYGIYSSPGPLTCGNRDGSYKHEFQDAVTYASWGVDFLKYDWCSYSAILKEKTLAEYKKPYQLMRDALDQTNRDILYAACQYGQGRIWEWAREINAQMWRTGGDIDDNWPTLLQIVFSQVGLEKYASPGYWNDPDMMVLGNIGWGSVFRPTKLNPHEQMSHMTFWVLLAAPILLGCDLKNVDPFTFDLLTHEEVLAIHQDYPGRQGWRLKSSAEEEIWIRPLSDGSWVAGLFNMGLFRSTLSLQWDQLGLAAPQKVRNIWERKELGVFAEGFQVEVPSHGVVFIRIKS